MSTRLIPRCLAPLLMLPLLGCAGGALGAAQMASDCAATEAACQRSAFNAPLAVGAQVRPETVITMRGSGAPSLHLESADPEVLAVTKDGIRGKSAGLAALLLVSETGTVLDFFHVWVKPATRVALLAQRDGQQYATEESPQLLVGESMVLVAELVGDGQRLAGDAEIAWSADPPIVKLLSDGRGSTRRVVALTAGRTTLSVASLGQTATLVIEVAKADMTARATEVKL